MNKSKIALTLGIVCFILTIGICVQINTITKSNVSVSQTLSKDSLRDEVLKWKEKYDIKLAELALEEYEKSGKKTYTMDEVFKK